MTDPIQPGTDPADLRGPGDPDAVEARQPHVEPGQAGNIREEQMNHAAGTVPAAYVGSGDGDADPENRPEDAGDAGNWDDDV
jgi:hypothetical protein